MDKDKKLNKIIFETFDQEIEGCDVYEHLGSKWLIMTETKRWIVEFTKEKTLWFNYTFFNDVLTFFGMSASDDRQYIKNWYEDRFIFNKKVIRNEDTIQNEVKDTKKPLIRWRRVVEDTIQNGVKLTQLLETMGLHLVEDTIQNGVKLTGSTVGNRRKPVEDTIQNGVKLTEFMFNRKSVFVEDTIQNGVKLTDGVKFMSGTIVEDTIQNGVKDVKSIKLDRNSRHGIFKMEDEIPTYIPMGQVQDVVQNGVKQ